MDSSFEQKKPDASYVGDVMKMSKLGKLLNYASLVKKQTGKSYFQQLSEIARLSSHERHLGIEEYYELGVFDDKSYSGRQKFDCVGWKASYEIDKNLNHDYWRATANDKVLNYALLQHYGFPIPDTFATYSPNRRCIGSELSLNSEKDLEDFLLHSLQFPVFIKPIHGSFGRGTYSLISYDAPLRCFIDVRGEKVFFADLLESCLTRQYRGMLFQKCLQPHEEVQAMIGSTTSCVRIIVAMTKEGPKIHMAFWKMARAHNITDNFCMGESGNLLAWVNKNTGSIERIVSGLWPNGTEVPRHPDTQQELLGKNLPDWQQATSMCLSAAVHFPGLKLQHWDIAFCRQGPVLMELNTEADLGVPQFLGRTPFLDATIKELLVNT
ncbi:sugar-transfer associated ATP-grasp domain-containing protein [Sulfurimicrobium lacus]|nr:sugar-transfer associated ATP-grasp domain-containing protein [Sulfurimicrobium lacus]